MPSAGRDGVIDPRLLELKGDIESHIIAIERALLRTPFCPIRAELDKLNILPLHEWKQLVEETQG